MAKPNELATWLVEADLAFTEQDARLEDGIVNQVEMQECLAMLK